MEKEKRVLRRASFVENRRKSLTFSNIFQDQKEEEVNTNDSDHSVKTIKTYLDSLTKEKQDWKDILKQKKIAKKSSEDKYKFDQLIIKKENIEEYIPPEYKEFLENKPNYSELTELIKKYVYSIHYLNSYKSDIIHYYNKACSELEVNQKTLVDAMCADDLCDICNTKNCQISEHRFSV